MSEKIVLATKRQPSKEELLQAAAEKPVHGVFTVDAHGLDEEGAVFDGYRDFELRNSDLRMRVSFPDGITRGEILFYLSRLVETVRDERGWNYLTFPSDIKTAGSDEAGRA